MSQPRNKSTDFAKDKRKSKGFEEEKAACYERSISYLNNK